MFRSVLILVFLCWASSVFAQSEVVDNQMIMEMSRSGLSSEIILRKITSSHSTFDVSAPALIQLKQSGVEDTVIAALLDRNEDARQSPTQPQNARSSESGFSESGTNYDRGANPLIGARTIAFGKSSLQPSRQALEKELMKRKDFQQLHLTILRYKESADLLVDIGFVSGSWVTHRYVYRVYDRRTGAVIAAGETTSWGSLAENLARHIAKRLTVARAAAS